MTCAVYLSLQDHCSPLQVVAAIIAVVAAPTAPAALPVLMACDVIIMGWVGGKERADAGWQHC